MRSTTSRIGTMGGTTFKALTLAVAIAACLPHYASAAEPVRTREAVVNFNIPAGDLSTALERFSTQSGIQAMYRQELIRNKSGRAVSGTLSPSVALARLLEGTGLSVERVNDKTYVLKAAPPTPPASRKQTPQPSPKASEQVGVGQDVQELEKMVVVGSRLGTSPVESAMPIRVITRDQIDRSGAGNIAQALSYLSEVSVNSTGDRSIGNNNGVGTGSSNSTTVQMRGLPRGTTLVLINGRRAGESASFTDTGQFDLSTIPLSLVDRIEVLPAGSSAVYGGDGLAGVVNIVLRQDADGFEFRLRHSSADGYSSQQASLMWGKRWSKGGLTAIVNWRDNGALTSAERSLTADADFRRFGGRDYRSYNGNPATIYSYAGCDLTMEYCEVPLEERGNLPGLESPFAVVPTTSNGVGLTPADFLATQGQRNRTTIPRQFRSPETSYGVTFNGDFDLSDRLELFGEFTYSKRDVPAEEMSLYIAGGEWRYGPNGRIPANHPFNPFGVELGIDYEFADTGVFNDYLQSYYRGAVGLRGSFKRFEWEVSAWQARDNSETVGGYFSEEAVNAALASTDPATTLNPFVGDGSPPASTEFLETLRSPLTHVSSSRTGGVTGYVRGTVASLPAGNLVALLGAETQKTSFTMRSDFLISPENSGSSTSHALFAEARVPLIAPAEGERWERMAATAALRRETSDRFDSSAMTETLGLEYRPLETLLLRATYSTAFRPLLTYQAGQDVRDIQNPVTDPLAGDAEYWVTIIGGGGVPADLRPERSVNRTVGLVYRPSDDWNLSLNYWRIRFQDRITVISAQSIVDAEADYPGRVIRDPVTNVIEAVDARNVNIAMMSVSGVDLGIDGHWSTDVGSFYASLNATYTHEYDQQRTPTSPVVDYLARHNSAGWAPRWKIVPRVGWDRGDWFRTMLTGRYVSSYRDSIALSSGPEAGRYLTLGNFWLVDLNVDMSVGKLLKDDSFFSQTRLSVGATNLFNRLPEFCAGCLSVGYDGSQYDIDGRTIYAELRTSF
jgi:iron complex outermembrane receptor protein